MALKACSLAEVVSSECRHGTTSLRATESKRLQMDKMLSDALYAAKHARVCVPARGGEVHLTRI